MKVNGSATLGAPVLDVWNGLRDPAVLARAIPGCESLVETAPDTYAVTLRAGVASIRGTYAGQVTLSDPEPPHAFTLRARGQGVPGTVEATVRVRLSDDDGGGTRVDYDADAVVGGMIGGVGQRMLAGVGRRTAGEFFAAVEGVLSAPEAAAPPSPVPAPAAGAPTLGVAAPGVAAPGVAAPAAPRAAALLAAFGAGGAVALAGVALGWALARRSRA